MCKNYAIMLIDNGNISNMDLYQVGLHLLEESKLSLHNFFFFQTSTHTTLWI